MLGFLRKFLGPDGSPGQDGAVEEIGLARVPRRLGIEILQATTERQQLTAQIRNRMEHIWRDRLFELVDRILIRFSLYVWDLPASERDHHSQPFGLLDHSLEVAAKTLESLSGSSFRVSPDPAVDYAEKPGWHYGALIGALCHDLAKVFCARVRLCEKSPEWDPLREPLASYLLRHRRDASGPESWDFVVGRGLGGFAWRTGEVLPFILTPEARDYAKAQLPWIEKTLVCGTKEERYALCPPARRIKEAFGTTDHTTSRDDAFGKKTVHPKENPSEVTDASSPAETLTTEQPDSDASNAEVPERKGAEDPALSPPAPTPPPPPPRIPKRKTVIPEHKLHPRFLRENLGRMLSTAKLSRNNVIAAAYITRKVTWFVASETLGPLARFIKVPVSKQSEEELLEALCSLSVPFEDGHLLRVMQPTADVHKRGAFVIETGTLLTSEDLRRLGTWNDRIRESGPWRTSETSPQPVWKAAS